MGWMTHQFKVYDQMNLTDYEDLDCTPPVSDTGKVMAEPSQTMDNSLTVHLDSEESVPLLNNDHLDASDEENVNPSSKLNPPYLDNLVDMFDIATYYSTNLAALASPVKLSKFTKPMCKMTRKVAAPTKLAEDVKMSKLQPLRASDMTPDTSSRLKRQRKLLLKFDDAGSDGIRIEAEPTEKKRKISTHQ